MIFEIFEPRQIGERAGAVKTVAGDKLGLVRPRGARGAPPEIIRRAGAAGVFPLRFTREREAAARFLGEPLAELHRLGPRHADDRLIGVVASPAFGAMVLADDVDEAADVRRIEQRVLLVHDLELSHVKSLAVGDERLRRFVAVIIRGPHQHSAGGNQIKYEAHPATEVQRKFGGGGGVGRGVATSARGKHVEDRIGRRRDRRDRGRRRGCGERDAVRCRCGISFGIVCDAGVAGRELKPAVVIIRRAADSLVFTPTAPRGDVQINPGDQMIPRICGQGHAVVALLQNLDQLAGVSVPLTGIVQAEITFVARPAHVAMQVEIRNRESIPGRGWREAIRVAKIRHHIGRPACATVAAGAILIEDRLHFAQETEAAFRAVPRRDRVRAFARRDRGMIDHAGVAMFMAAGTGNAFARHHRVPTAENRECLAFVIERLDGNRHVGGRGETRRAVLVNRYGAEYAMHVPDAVHANVHMPALAAVAVMDGIDPQTFDLAARHVAQAGAEVNIRNIHRASRCPDLHAVRNHRRDRLHANCHRMQ